MTAKKTTKAEPATVPQGIAEAAARVKAAAEALDAARLAQADAELALNTQARRVFDAKADFDAATEALIQVAAHS